MSKDFSSGATQLLSILPYVIDYQDEEEKLPLRLLCHEALDLHDRFAQVLSLFTVGHALRITCNEDQVHFPSPDEIARSVSAMVARGCRPTCLELVLPWTSEDDAPTQERRVLAMLGAVSGTGSVSSVRVSAYTPITPGIATALSEVGITDLLLQPGMDYFLGETTQRPERVPPPPKPAEVERAAAAVERLLQLTGPKLLRLEISSDPLQRFVPLRAVSAVSYCTALQELDLHCFWDERTARRGIAAEMALLQSISGISTLRSLTLSGGAAWLPPVITIAEQREALAEHLETCLARLTGLESLELNLHRLQHFPDQSDYRYKGNVHTLSEQLHALAGAELWEVAMQLDAAAHAEWRAVVSAIQHMPRLVDLRVPLRANVADLAALTNLTTLRVGALELPREEEEEDEPEAPAGHCAVEDPVYQLPTSLRRLETHSPLTARVAAALRLPKPPPGEPVCTLVAGGPMHGAPRFPWCIELGSHRDMDDHDCLLASAAKTMTRAAGVLSEFGLHEELCPDKWPRGLQVYGIAGVELRPPLPPGQAANPDSLAGSHVESWLGGLATLRPDVLSLVGLYLPSRDMLALARSMPNLKSLELIASRYEPSALPLLAGMPALELLIMARRDWLVPVLDDAALAGIEAAFLALTAADAPEAAAGAEGRDQKGRVVSLPRLRAIHVYCTQQDEAALVGALAGARRQLAKRGNGAVLDIGPFLEA